MSDIEKSFPPPGDDGPHAFDRERERLHRQMMSTLSHDLKTPIASIIGSLEVYERMQHRLTAEKKQALIEVALHEAYRLDTFTSNILDMAKLDNGMVNVRREAVEVGGLLRDCLSGFGTRLRTCKVDYAGLAALAVTSDAALLGRAVGVVIDNAIRYAGAQAHITLALSRQADDAVVAISDNGPGIAADSAAAIFEKYTRLPVKGQTASGMGLGLAIGRASMRLLGGDLTAANHMSGGAVFTLRFPVD